MLARVIADAIEGGRAGILRPERRWAVMELADRLGVRAFDACLLIAVIQDRARRGEPLDAAGAFAMLGAPEPVVMAAPNPMPGLALGPATKLAASAALALAGVIAAAGWLIGG